MLLIVDANISFAACVAKEGGTRKLIFEDTLTLVSPRFMLTELEKYFPLIVEKSGLPLEEVRKNVGFIMERIQVISFEKYVHFLPKAKEISPDQNDAEYLALALALGCPLWSNDKHLKAQSEVKVLSTSELIQLLSD